jgi:hypothetical protein
METTLPVLSWQAFFPLTPHTIPNPAGSRPQSTSWAFFVNLPAA